MEIRPREQENLGAQLTTPADLVLRNASPLALSINRKGISIQRAELVARNTDFFASGTLSFGSKNPWDLKLTGKIDLAILDSFNRDMQAKGVSTIDATVRGPFGQPQVNGRMELANASFSVRGLPNGIENANGVILFDRNRANIDRLTAQTGGGDISLGGFVGFGGNEMVYRLQAKANRVRVRYPEGVSTTVDAELSLTGTSSRSLLSGTVTIVRSGFTPRTDLAGLLAQAGKPIPAPATPNPFLQGLQFDVRVVTAPNVEVQTALTTNLEMEAALRLRGSPAKPILLGTVKVNRGEIQFFGNKYTITRGDISFFNTARIEPVLNMDLETRQRAVIVNINFSGPFDKLNVTYRSDPPLQPSEIIALLAVGRTPASTDPTMVSGLQTAQGNQSLFQSGANSLLGAALTAPVSGRLERFFGVSRVKIDPQLTGIDNTPQARLTLEQQISTDVTLTYVTNLNRSQQQLVRLEWDLTQEWSVVAIRDENGVFGIDFVYRRRFR
jgi:translocation and assembly module TamB